LGYRKRRAKDDRQNKEIAENFGADQVTLPQMGWVSGQIQAWWLQVPGE
jgi:hypothetical protein